MARVNYKPRPRQPVRERPARKPQRPANDNTPVANDNDIQDAVRAAGDMPFSKWQRKYAPILRQLNTAKTLWDLYNEFNQPEYSLAGQGNWIVENACGGGVGWGNAALGCSIAGSFVPQEAQQHFIYGPVPANIGRISVGKVIPNPDPGGFIPYIAQGGAIYRRVDASAAEPWPGMPLRNPQWNLRPDPNIVRNLPGIPVQPDPYDQVEPETDTPSEWQFASPSPNGDPSPHRRQPPGGTVKEGKYKSKAAALGVALYKALDDVSEWSETVDAVYGALPKAVRKRWERDRLAEQRDRNQFAGGLDQYGQYGIDGADWKLQALWYNWDKVDIGVAVENIIDNYIEDKVIGAYQKLLPPQVVNALDQVQANGDKLPPEAVVSKMLKLIKEYLGLSYNPNMWMKGT